MRMSPTLITTALAVVLLGAYPSTRSAAAAPQDEDGGYAWAETCKSCHPEIYEAWSKTKHAKALNRLTSGDQQKDCVGCHVTGPKARIEQQGKVVNAGVQCEACHGKAAAHANDPTLTAGLVRKAPASVCTECHNEKSPRFRGFVYNGMIGFAHPVKK